MPTIRKATRGSEFLHGYGTVSGGETVDVDADTAAYLVESGAYEHVPDSDDESDGESDADTDTSEGIADTDADGDGEQELALSVEYVDEQIDAGVCPWCPEDDDDRYEGENVGRHASSAHPEKWTAHKEATE